MFARLEQSLDHPQSRTRSRQRRRVALALLASVGSLKWHGWHAARRGLGSNLYRLGVPDMVIQLILRHGNVSTTATHYIKTAADDVRKAMTKMKDRISGGNLAQLTLMGY